MPPLLRVATNVNIFNCRTKFEKKKIVRILYIKIRQIVASKRYAPMFNFISPELSDEYFTRYNQL